MDLAVDTPGLCKALMKLFLLVFIFIFTETSCVKLSGKEDARIRKGLLGILKRFHQGLDPLALPQVPKKLTGVGKGSLMNLQINILSSVTSNFLDLKALSKFSFGNSEFPELVRFAVILKLRSFCPHFVSDDDLVNNFIIAVILEHFPESVTKDSEYFHDELQILTFKYARNMLTFDTIPEYIYFYLLAFLHEIAYGIDASVPIHYFAFIYHALRASINHKLPKFWKFFEDSDSGISEKEKALILSFHENFIKADIETNPKAEELKKEIEHYLHLECVYAEICIQRNIPFAPLDRFILISTQETGCNMSSELFEVYLKSPDTIQYFSASHKTSRLQASNSTLSKMIISSRGCPGPFDYFWTRNSIDQFSMGEFNKTDDEAIGLLWETISIESPSLAHLDAFAQVVSECTSNDLSSVLAQCYNSLFLEIIFKEARVPLNIFYYASSGYLRATWNTMNTKLIDFFFEYLKSDDPLVLLTLCPLMLRQFSSKIRNKKFNLNKRYSFDFTERNLHFGFDTTTIFSDLQGKVVSFKQIVNITNLSAYKDCFTSTPEEFDDLSTVDMINPPISINFQTIIIQG